MASVRCQSELSQSISFLPGFDGDTEESKCVISGLRIAFAQAAEGDSPAEHTDNVGIPARSRFNWGTDLGEDDDPKALFTWVIPDFTAQISGSPNNGMGTIIVKTGGRFQGEAEEDVVSAPAGGTAHRHEWNIGVAPGVVTMWDDRPWGFVNHVNSAEKTSAVPIDPDSEIDPDTE